MSRFIALSSLSSLESAGVGRGHTMPSSSACQRCSYILSRRITLAELLRKERHVRDRPRGHCLAGEAKVSFCSDDLAPAFRPTDGTYLGGVQLPRVGENYDGADC